MFHKQYRFPVIEALLNGTRQFRDSENPGDKWHNPMFSLPRDSSSSRSNWSNQYQSMHATLVQQNKHHTTHILTVRNGNWIEDQNYEGYFLLIFMKYVTYFRNYHFNIDFLLLFHHSNTFHKGNSVRNSKLLKLLPFPQPSWATVWRSSRPLPTFCFLVGSHWGKEVTSLKSQSRANSNIFWLTKFVVAEHPLRLSVTRKVARCDDGLLSQILEDVHFKEVGIEEYSAKKTFIETSWKGWIGMLWLNIGGLGWDAAKKSGTHGTLHHDVLKSAHPGRRGCSWPTTTSPQLWLTWQLST